MGLGKRLVELRWRVWDKNQQDSFQKGVTMTIKDREGIRLLTRMMLEDLYKHLKVIEEAENE